MMTPNSRHWMRLAPKIVTINDGRAAIVPVSVENNRAKIASPEAPGGGIGGFLHPNRARLQVLTWRIHDGRIVPGAEGRDGWGLGGLVLDPAIVGETPPGSHPLPMYAPWRLRRTVVGFAAIPHCAPT